MQHSDGGDRRRRCPACSGDLRLSHREYAGRGLQAAVWRCSSCGEVTRDAARDRPSAAGRTRRERPPVDEGPPPNPVLDPETASRLLRRDSEEA